VWVKVSIWWSLVALVVGLLLPVESCGLKRWVLGETLVVFVGPGGQRVETRTVDGDTWDVRVRTGRGMVERVIRSTDSGGFGVWVAWPEDGKRVFVLSCGGGVSRGVDTIAVEEESGGGADAVASLARSMRFWFGESPFLKQADSDSKVVEWFCVGTGRAALYERVQAAGGKLAVNMAGKE
jgi:hypothetical protein